MEGCKWYGKSTAYALFYLFHGMKIKGPVAKINCD